MLVAFKNLGYAIEDFKRVVVETMQNDFLKIKRLFNKLKPF